MPSINTLSAIVVPAKVDRIRLPGAKPCEDGNRFSDQIGRRVVSRDL